MERTVFEYEKGSITVFWAHYGILGGTQTLNRHAWKIGGIRGRASWVSSFHEIGVLPSPFPSPHCWAGGTVAIVFSSFGRRFTNCPKSRIPSLEDPAKKNLKNEYECFPFHIFCVRN